MTEAELIAALQNSLDKIQRLTVDLQAIIDLENSRLKRACYNPIKETKGG